MENSVARIRVPLAGHAEVPRPGAHRTSPRSALSATAGGARPGDWSGGQCEVGHWLRSGALGRGGLSTGRGGRSRGAGCWRGDWSGSDRRESVGCVAATRPLGDGRPTSAVRSRFGCPCHDRAVGLQRSRPFHAPMGRPAERLLRRSRAEGSGAPGADSGAAVAAAVGAALADDPARVETVGAEATAAAFAPLVPLGGAVRAAGRGIACSMPGGRAHELSVPDSLSVMTVCGVGNHTERRLLPAFRPLRRVAVEALLFDMSQNRLERVPGTTSSVERLTVDGGRRNPAEAWNALARCARGAYVLLLPCDALFHLRSIRLPELSEGIVEAEAGAGAATQCPYAWPPLVIRRDRLLVAGGLDERIGSEWSVQELHRRLRSQHGDVARWPVVGQLRYTPHWERAGATDAVWEAQRACAAITQRLFIAVSRGADWMVRGGSRGHQRSVSLRGRLQRSCAHSGLCPARRALHTVASTARHERAAADAPAHRTGTARQRPHGAGGGVCRRAPRTRQPAASVCLGARLCPHDRCGVCAGVDTRPAHERRVPRPVPERRAGVAPADRALAAARRRVRPGVAARRAGQLYGTRWVRGSQIPTGVAGAHRPLVFPQRLHDGRPRRHHEGVPGVDLATARPAAASSGGAGASATHGARRFAADDRCAHSTCAARFRDRRHGRDQGVRPRCVAPVACAPPYAPRTVRPLHAVDRRSRAAHPLFGGRRRPARHRLPAATLSGPRLHASARVQRPRCALPAERPGRPTRTRSHTVYPRQRVELVLRSGRLHRPPPPPPPVHLSTVEQLGKAETARQVLAPPQDGHCGTAQRGQVDLLQHAVAVASAGGELPVLHHRAERGAGDAAGRAIRLAVRGIPASQSRQRLFRCVGYCGAAAYERPRARAAAVGGGGEQDGARRAQHAQRAAAGAGGVAQGGDVVGGAGGAARPVVQCGDRGAEPTSVSHRQAGGGVGEFERAGLSAQEEQVAAADQAAYWRRCADTVQCRAGVSAGGYRAGPRARGGRSILRAAGSGRAAVSAAQDTALRVSGVAADQFFHRRAG
eukprot:ctg_544.g320